MLLWRSFHCTHSNVTSCLTSLLVKVVTVFLVLIELSLVVCLHYIHGQGIEAL